MTIKIYSDAFSKEPCNTVEYSGYISDLLKENGIEYTYKNSQPVSFYVNGECIDAQDWSKIKVKDSDNVEMRIIPHGGIFSAIGNLVSSVISWIFPKPKVKTRSDTPKGEQIAASNANANVAKLYGTVPEVAGRFIRYPEALVPIRSYFDNPRTLNQEMLLCVSAGDCDIDASTVKIGTTPILNLEGAEFHVYKPGDDVSSHGLHWNYYRCPEVGSTAAGGAGLALTSSPSSDLDPTAESYSFSSKTMTATPLPSGWSVGTRMYIRITRPFNIENPEDSDYSSFIGSFVDIAHLEVGDIVSSSIGEELRISYIDVDANGDGEAQFDYLNDFSDWIPLKQSVATDFAAWFSDPEITLRISAITSSSVTYDAIRDEAVFSGWGGFGTITSIPRNVLFDVDGSEQIGEWSGPFNACPESETTARVEYDIFFPRGLCRVSDSGNLRWATVQVEIQWRYSGGSWQSVIRNYGNNTMDQIGYTHSISTPLGGAIQVRMRRIGAESTSTQVNDEVQWYGLRARLTSPTTYPDWTVVGVRFRGLDKISSESGNKLNLVATRKLGTLQSDGTIGYPVATREISAFALHIAQSVGYTLSEWDIDALQQLNSVWKSRGETLDFSFTETTVEKALDTAFSAGMSEFTIDDGLLKPVRLGVRTMYEQAYSAQNTTDGFNRSFTLERVDSNDGVLVEYIDQAEGFTAKTVTAKLPGKIGARLRTLKLDGVVSRNRAWRIGMREARTMEYQKWAYKFTTPMDAMNSSYGSYVALIPDIANYGQSGLITGSYGRTLIVGEYLDFEEGKSYVIAWRDERGRFVGPFSAERGESDQEVIVGGSTALPVVKMDRELPHFFFGEISTLSLPAIVQKITPNASGECSVQAVNYDSRIYADDENNAHSGA